MTNTHFHLLLGWSGSLSSRRGWRLQRHLNVSCASRDFRVQAASKRRGIAVETALVLILNRFPRRYAASAHNLGWRALLYAFEDCVLDEQRRELRRAASPVPIGPQVFDLVVFLIRNRERVVSQDDLLTAVWEGRIVSESTLRSHIQAARAAIGDTGEAQRLIRTMPRKGFRFVGEVRQQENGTVPAVPTEGTPAVAPAAAIEPAPAGAPQAVLPVVVASAAPERIEVLPPPVRRPWRNGLSRTALIGGAAALLAIVAVFITVSRYAGFSTKTRSASEPRETFDATSVPLMTNAARQSLASYSTLPKPKALAISSTEWGLASGTQDIESAKKEALDRCAVRSRSTKVCRIYATDMDVVWSRTSLFLPLPADLRSSPLEDPLVPDELPLIAASTRQLLADGYLNAPDHKALAFHGRSMFWHTRAPDQAEAVRLAVERCGERYQVPCLLLSVDGKLTVRLPKSRSVVDKFMLTTATEMSPQDKERIGLIYQQKDWRALARGKSGNWYPVANASSESAAVDAALKSCAQQDAECVIHAIGNFRVADAN
jgi:DNA-binding winged helix-turn-helix (wHTH) protein